MSAIAIVRPMPRLAPVTIQVLPSKLNFCSTLAIDSSALINHSWTILPLLDDLDLIRFKEQTKSKFPFHFLRIHDSRISLSLYLYVIGCAGRPRNMNTVFERVNATDSGQTENNDGWIEFQALHAIHLACTAKDSLRKRDVSREGLEILSIRHCSRFG